MSDLKKLSDATPNIKRVRVVTYSDNAGLSDNAIAYLPAILKIISDFKKLESLHCAMDYRDLLKIGNSGVEDLLNIIKDFPIKVKVVIAGKKDYNDVANLIEKEEGKPPKIVKSLSPRPTPRSGSSFLPKTM